MIKKYKTARHLINRDIGRFVLLKTYLKLLKSNQHITTFHIPLFSAHLLPSYLLARIASAYEPDSYASRCHL